MAQGRRPKPAELKVVTGTYRKDRDKGLQTKAKKAAPSAKQSSQPPKWLSDYARSEWRRIIPELNASGLYRKIDRAALEAYCESVATARQCSEALEAYRKQLEDDLHEGEEMDARYAGGLMMKTGQGSWMQHPAVGIRNKAYERIKTFSIEFGMTPASRARVTSDDEPDEIDPAAAYFD